MTAGLITQIAVIVTSFAAVKSELKSNEVDMVQNFTHLYPDGLLIDVPPVCEGPTSSCPVVLLIPPMGSIEYFVNVNEAYRASRANGFITVFLAPGKINATHISVSMNRILTEMGAIGRYYAFGRSMGGRIAQALAIRSGDPGALRLSGISVNGAPLVYVDEDPNYNDFPHVNTPKVAQQSIRCQYDEYLPLRGGRVVQGANEEFEPSWCVSENASNEWWKHHNDCSGALSTKPMEATATQIQAKGGRAFNVTAHHYVWGDCPSGAYVEYVIVGNCQHGEHTHIEGRPYEEFGFGFLSKVEDSKKKRAHELNDQRWRRAAVM